MNNPDLLPRPTLRQLEYVVAVADHLHFGRAAAACLVTQPGLSTQIQQLEELLGVTIFERSRRKVLVTGEGERIVARARETLRAADELVRTAHESRRPLEGDLRLGVIPTIAPYLLPRVLPQVRARYPKLKLLLTEERTESLVRGLREGRLDLLLLALPIDGDDLASMELCKEPFVLVAPEGHRLAKRQNASQEELAAEPILLLEEGHCLRQQALELCSRVGATEYSSFRATSMTTLVQMVANGLGATLIPSLALPVEMTKGLVARRFKRPAPTRTLGLLWRKSSGREASFRLLGELLAAHATKLVKKAI